MKTCLALRLLKPWGTGALGNHIYWETSQNGALAQQSATKMRSSRVATGVPRATKREACPRLPALISKGDGRFDLGDRDIEQVADRLTGRGRTRALGQGG
jgi:hypothetical protein